MNSLAVGLRLNSLALGLRVDLLARSGVCWEGLTEATGVVGVGCCCCCCGGDVWGGTDVVGVSGVGVVIICPGEASGVILGAGVVLGGGWGEVALDPESPPAKLKFLVKSLRSATCCSLDFLPPGPLWGWGASSCLSESLLWPGDGPPVSCLVELSLDFLLSNPPLSDPLSLSGRGLVFFKSTSILFPACCCPGAPLYCPCPPPLCPPPSPL